MASRSNDQPEGDSANKYQFYLQVRRDLAADLDGEVPYVEEVSVLSDLLKGGMWAGASGEPERGVQEIKPCSHTSLLLCGCENH